MLHDRELPHVACARNVLALRTSKSRSSRLRPTQKQVPRVCGLPRSRSLAPAGARDDMLRASLKEEERKTRLGSRLPDFVHGMNLPQGASGRIAVAVEGRRLARGST